ncbi:MAG: RNA polymerase sigma factor [Acidimicrobiia bacterium]|nr:RNA polymerase sigma factor [Acidimicrobiia bacterium]
MDPVEQVYRTHHQRLWRGLLAYSGDPDIATDAAAETYAQALARGDALTNPEGWIWQTAFRVAAGMLSDRSQWLAITPGGADRSAGSRHHSVQFDQPLAEFLDQLGSLSDQQRTIVVLRYAGGYTPADIAEILGTSANVVRVQLHRAHAHLRERIGRT